MNPSIFKSYDIRGVYPKEADEAAVERIGRAIVAHLGAKVVAVGRDNRVSSPSLFQALVSGITRAGADVVDIGLVSTPMAYFASATLRADATVMITASHNPPEYNGLKVCRANAVPMGLGGGLEKIKELALGSDIPDAAKCGSLHAHNAAYDYDAFIAGFARFGERRFRIAIDAAHAMGAMEIPIFDQLGANVAICGRLYDTLRPPGSCPHEANPLKHETLIELQHLVRETRADLGIAYDGDADRVGFVDEKGQVVRMDLVTALLARETLARKPGATILYDLRSSRSVKEVIEELGGVALECRVGHAHIKKHMIEAGAALAGEASGHYYFTEGGYSAEMGTLPAIFLMSLMAREGKTLSQLVAEVSRYAHSGEINLDVADPKALLEKAKGHFGNGIVSELDGLKVVYPKWWFSLRASNTEPVVRLNLEAETEDEMESHKEEILALANA
jgi:phosphomannomutase